jgi:N,N'-diacetylchitobiose transport system substrate-binding protein
VNTITNRRRRSPIAKTLAALAATGLLVAACGSDDDTSDAGTDTEGTTATSDDVSSGEGGSIRLWLNGGDTPDELVEYAAAEFAKLHPDVSVEFERQQWTGIVEKLTTALSSSDSPDVVEFGNTQAQTFQAAGAVIDLTDDKADLGGDDLLTSLAEAGTYDGRFYAVPYYAGARIMIYRTDLFEEAGIEVPTTLEETLAAAVALKDASDDPNFSGFYLPGRNWYAMLSFLWEYGGDIAVQEDGEWVGQLSTPESIEGLTAWKQFFDEANAAPADGDDANDYIAFCNGEVGMMPAPGWKPGQILNEDDGCPELEDSIGVFALPGIEAGTTAPVFLGGSNLAIPVNSENQELALDLLKIMIGPGFQAQFAEAGTIPALKSELAKVDASPAAIAQAKAAENSNFVPTSENWAGVEAANILPDMLTKIAQGTDIATAAAEADAAIEAALNG